MSVKIWYGFNGNNSSSIDVVWLSQEKLDELLKKFIVRYSKIDPDFELAFYEKQVKDFKAERAKQAKRGYFEVGSEFYDDSVEEFVLSKARKISKIKVPEDEGVSILFVGKKPSHSRVLKLLAKYRD